jgi:hypothetical protein
MILLDTDHLTEEELKDSVIRCRGPAEDGDPEMLD